MVAHDEVLACRQIQLRLGAVVGEAHRYVGLCQTLAVDVNGAMLDPNSVAGQRNNPLDVALGMVVRVAKDDNVAAMDFADAESELC